MTLKWFFFTVKADFFTLKFSFALFVFSEIFGNTTLTFPFGSLFLLIGSVFQWDGTKVSSRQGAVVAGSGRDKSRIRSQWRKFSLKKGHKKAPSAVYSRTYIYLTQLKNGVLACFSVR